eukprot:jgi/Mesvir1/15653/Mv03258-RA.1
MTDYDGNGSLPVDWDSGNISEACIFTRDLDFGDEGHDVSCLQQYLVKQGELADGLISGYVGDSTKAAIARWQVKNDIEPAKGYFGALSRQKYEEIVASGESVGGPAHFSRPPAATAHAISSDGMSSSGGSGGSSSAADRLPLLFVSTREVSLPTMTSVAAERQPPPPRKPLAGLRVAIDVGHGAHPLGFERGSEGNGLNEYDLNCVLSEALAHDLKKDGADVSVFKYGEHDPPLWLPERGRRAQGHNLFVSIHHNGHDGEAQGSETLVDVNATREDQDLAHLIQAELVQRVGFADRGVKWKNLGVLGGVTRDVEAACLVEPYFLDERSKGRRKDSAKLGPDLSRKAAVGIADGIRKYWTERNQAKFVVQVPYSGEEDFKDLQDIAPGAWCVPHKGEEGAGCSEVQVASFREYDRATALQEKLYTHGFDAQVIERERVPRTFPGAAINR